MKVDIRSKEGFSVLLKFLAVLFIIISFLVISDYPALAAFLSFTCLLILTGRSGVEIDREKKMYQEYMLFFFTIKMGKPKSFDSIKKITIEEERVTSGTILGKKQSLIYCSYLNFSDNNRVKLLSDNNKSVLEQKTKAIADKLATTINK